MSFKKETVAERTYEEYVREVYTILKNDYPVSQTEANLLIAFSGNFITDQWRQTTYSSVTASEIINERG